MVFTAVLFHDCSLRESTQLALSFYRVKSFFTFTSRPRENILNRIFVSELHVQQESILGSVKERTGVRGWQLIAISSRHGNAPQYNASHLDTGV